MQAGRFGCKSGFACSDFATHSLKCVTKANLTLPRKGEIGKMVKVMEDLSDANRVSSVPV